MSVFQYDESRNIIKNEQRHIDTMAMNDEWNFYLTKCPQYKSH